MCWLQPTEVILTSGRQYQFVYDDVGDVRSVTTPSMSRHHFHAVTLFGLQRIIYRPPATAGVYVEDHDSHGRLLTQRYPSGHRQIEYRWDTHGRLVAVHHGWFDVALSYVDEQGDALSDATVTSLAGDPYNLSLIHI